MIRFSLVCWKTQQCERAMFQCSLGTPRAENHTRTRTEAALQVPRLLPAAPRVSLDSAAAELRAPHPSCCQVSPALAWPTGHLPKEKGGCAGTWGQQRGREGTAQPQLWLAQELLLLTDPPAGTPHGAHEHKPIYVMVFLKPKMNGELFYLPTLGGYFCHKPLQTKAAGKGKAKTEQSGEVKVSEMVHRTLHCSPTFS